MNNRKNKFRGDIMKKRLIWVLVLMLSLILCACAPESTAPQGENTDTQSQNVEGEEGQTQDGDSLDGQDAAIDEEGVYTTKDDVALYIHTYGDLPSNFMTKNEARDLGWEGGGLDDFAEGMSIGGDHFGNYEELLPADRSYTECDIDTLGASKRGAKRIVFSEDGLIYYTGDHYETFELLYGEE